MSRGLRNNNPGNIKDFGIPWRGMQALEDRTPEQMSEDTFVVFRAAWWGIRALAILLLNYQRKHGLNTVTDVLGRYAPPSDNNPTSEYALFVAEAMDVLPREVIDLNRYEVMEAMIRAIIRFENGNCPYNCEIQTGLDLAGIEP